MSLLKPATQPSYLKIGCFGHTGTGKTWTMVQLLSQFIAEYVPGSQLAMFDTESGSGYIAPMVKRITGKELLVVHSQSFSELLTFADECRENNYVAILDSATHPWRSLCADYLAAKKTRVKAAHGNTDTVRLALKDWGPLKEMWNKFSDKLRYDPVHWCICGREGDVWEDVKDDEGENQLTKTGTKMKTETELGYEPSLLIRMTLNENDHIAFVTKERFGILTGKSAKDPDIEFFRPYLNLLNLGGIHPKPSDNPERVWPDGNGNGGMNWETIQKQRLAILDEIKDDLLLVYPGMDKDSKVGKVKALREVFQVGWTTLENDHKSYPVEVLKAGRESLQKYLKEKNNAKNSG